MYADLFALGIPVAEKLLRTLAVYAFLLVGLRLAGKRELGQLNPFDLVVLLLLSNTVQNAIIGNDNSLAGGVLGATALLIINWIVVRYLYTHPTVARWLEGDADVLIEGGKLHDGRMKRELITRGELEAAAPGGDVPTRDRWCAHFRPACADGGRTAALRGAGANHSDPGGAGSAPCAPAGQERPGLKSARIRIKPARHVHRPESLIQAIAADTNNRCSDEKRRDIIRRSRR
jgi:hypothetical protein